MRYGRAVYAYIRADGYSVEDAEDLTQGFFAKKVLGSKFLEGFDPSRSFRKYLPAVLKNYLRGKMREDLSQKRHPPGRIVSLEGLGEGSRIEPVDFSDPQRSFDYEWAYQRVHEAVEAVRVSLLERGKKEDWEIFNARTAGPLVDGAEAVPLKVLAKRFGKDEGTISRIVRKVELQYGRALRLKIREDVNSDAEVDAEIRELIRILSEYRANG
jgi:RNA polymerase sigma factor (sigma-70 family)